MHYRETVVWNKAMEIVRGIYGLVGALPKEEVFGVRSQMTRSAVSVPCNVAEGWTRESKKEKRQFLAIAHGSLAELETLLTVCEQMGWFSMDETGCVRESIDQVSRMLTSLRRQLRSDPPRSRGMG